MAYIQHIIYGERKVHTNCSLSMHLPHLNMYRSTILNQHHSHLIAHTLRQPTVFLANSSGYYFYPQAEKVTQSYLYKTLWNFI